MNWLIKKDQKCDWKKIIYPNMTSLSSFIQPYVVPNLYDFLFCEKQNYLKKNISGYIAYN